MNTGPDDSFAGSTVVITGAASGIGRAIAEAFLSVQAHVAAIDVDVDALASFRASQPHTESARLTIHDGDLSRVEDIRRLVGDAGSATGRIDVLVNNVGGSAGSPLVIDEVSEDDYDRVLNLNLKSAFFATQAALPFLRAGGGGAIVNLASISGRAGIASISPQYSAAKLALTRNLAVRLGGDNIRVNAIAPGYIRSGPRVDKIWESRDPSPILESIALHCRGETADIASAALFLSSPRSGYITGATIDVNGGFLAI
jgi:NAD(P)-dependent dehydrogenase (short-subunit alcohol dehydrogenase family)